MSDPDSTAPPKLDYFTPTFEPVYAGFWRRVVAQIVDLVLLGAATTAVVLSMEGLGQLSFGVRAALFSRTAEFIGTSSFWLGTWLYFASMESSPWRATLGKALVGIRVTGPDGSRISFLRATCRFWAKLITSFPLLGVGLLFAGVTAEKQALHDAIANTLVVADPE